MSGVGGGVFPHAVSSWIQCAQSSFGLRVYQFHAPAFADLHSLKSAPALRHGVDCEIKLGR